MTAWARSRRRACDDAAGVVLDGSVADEELPGDRRGGVPAGDVVLTASPEGTGVEHRGPGGDGGRLSIEGLGQPVSDDGASSVSPPATAINSAARVLLSNKPLAPTR
jgi:hypothetical protein